MRLVLLGLPGSGKGTLASKLASYYLIPHLSTGDIFRQAIKDETPLGKKVKSFLDDGSLVPDQLTISVVAQRLNQPDCAKGYLLDGFPRTIGQAEALGQMDAVKAHPLTAAINVVVAEPIIIERISNRRVCTGCGQTYNLAILPAGQEQACARCGGRLEQRPDDRIETVKQRLTAYYRQTAPLIDYYRQQKLLLEVNNESDIQQTLADAIAQIGRR